MSIQLDFYCLCDLCEDDLELVAGVIQSVMKPKHKLSRIKTSIDNLQLNSYTKPIEHLLQMPIKNLKAIIKFKEMGL